MALFATALAVSDPHFEVASVKANRSGPTGVRTLTLVPGGLRVTNLPLATILWMAHGVQQDQIVNMPSWTASESFDITAKAPAGVAVSAETFRPMLVDLLIERFQLRTHHEMRELPVYRLVRIDERTLGPRLQPAEFDCTGNSTQPPPSPEVAARLRNCGAGPRPTGFSVHGMPMRTFGRIVGPTAGRVIVDETGLTGNWDLDLDYTPDNPDAPSLFTAVREQLGLKLEAGHAMVDVIVIDHIDHPTDD